jgi:L-ascorbate metabolism protein UlaG (beta-lactamase superfamily)
MITILLLTLAPLAADTPPKAAYLSSPRRAFTAPELRDAPDEWLERSFAWANDMFRTYPPAVPEHPARRAALIRLDDILHIESAPKKPLVHRFYHDQVRQGVDDIEKTKLTSGARLWKIYSHSWIVRTPSVTVAFDLVPGPPGNVDFALPKGTMEKLARLSDVLFISHLHSDHANKEVAKLFLEQGKPVVAPEGLWKTDEYFATRLTYPQRSAEKVHEIAVRVGGPVLRYVAYPGHQGKAPINNNHMVISPEGFTVMHTGDQSSDDNDWSDFTWIMNVGFQHKVHVLLPNCWTTDIQRMARGVNPKLILTGHENEMSHTVDHREDNTQTYNHLFGTPYPFIVMSWGEGFTFHY